MIPGRMANYATYELSLLLMALTTQQRAAIDRIVQQIYIDNRPLAELFRGDNRICTEAKYYRRGVMDEETGGWRLSPGWHHDKAFQDALKEATRLALAVRTKEELAALATAKRRARLAAGDIVFNLLGIVHAGDKDSDRVNAGRTLLDYAETDVADETGSAATDEASDWWKAAEG